LTDTTKTTPEVATQEKKQRFSGLRGFFNREGWSAWMRQLPHFRLPPADPNFDLLSDESRLNAILSKAPVPVQERIKADRDILKTELLPYFRKCDRAASQHQNDHRLYQISYILLATLATIIGSFQALSVSAAPGYVPWLAFGEVIVALSATWLSNISSKEPPFQSWLENRRKAEILRREYFRFLMNAAPYDGLQGYQRRQTLATRVANVNRGVYPDEVAKS
jgi:hypothetical protein